MSSTTTVTRNTTTRSRPKHINFTSLRPIVLQNPHIILTHDIVRNTKTLHYTIRTFQPPSPNSDYSQSMRGYFGIMSTSDNSSVSLNGNGEKVCLENKHHLWQPKSVLETGEPLWHLRVSVLKDQEGQGDCPSRYFVCSSIDIYQWKLLTGKNRHSNQCIISLTQPINLRQHSEIHLTSGNAAATPQTLWVDASMTEDARTLPSSMNLRRRKRDGSNSSAG